MVVLTGFLGSGKTTLLRRLLLDRRHADTAVLVNEVGEISLDHHLIRTLSGEVMQLSSGCLCCATRGDLIRTLGELRTGALEGRLPPFARVVIETTGLADPTPILATLLRHGAIARGYRLASVVTTVDAQLGLPTLLKHAEARKQVIFADRLVLTKIDLADEEQANRLRLRLRLLNPQAPIHPCARGDLDPALLLEQAPLSPGPRDDVRDDSEDEHEHGHEHGHLEDVESEVVCSDGPIDVGVYGAWLSITTQIHGETLLRTKGILRTGEGEPVVVQSAQHVVYPAERLARWPDDDRRTRVVLVARKGPEGLVRQLGASLGSLFRPRGQIS